LILRGTDSKTYFFGAQAKNNVRGQKKQMKDECVKEVKYEIMPIGIAPRILLMG